MHCGATKILTFAGVLGVAMVVRFGDLFDDGSHERHRSLSVAKRVLHVLPNTNTTMVCFGACVEFGIERKRRKLESKLYVDSVDVESRKGMLASLSPSTCGMMDRRA
ncbi:hypothetical protein VNO77_20299 [Canavalia gladiata]|uniref:Uncharacterized protein n=1 Tax=Canavalia gladiata TaxID=3824 RepID=A0AAN9QMA5_CANGL